MVHSGSILAQHSIQWLRPNLADVDSKSPGGLPQRFKPAKAIVDLADQQRYTLLGNLATSFIMLRSVSGSHAPPGTMSGMRPWRVPVT